MIRTIFPSKAKDTIRRVVKSTLTDEKLQVHETTKGFNAPDAVDDLKKRLLFPARVVNVSLTLLTSEPQMKAIGALISSLSLVRQADTFYQKCVLEPYCGTLLIGNPCLEYCERVCSATVICHFMW